MKTTLDKLTAAPLLANRADASLPFLTRTDVAVIWTEVRRRKAKAEGKPAPTRPITEATVSSYLDKSKPADEATGRPAGRYADDPVPAPTYMGKGTHGNRPIWLPAPGETLDDLAVRIARWYARRPGHGVGGGRPRKDTTDPRQGRA